MKSGLTTTVLVAAAAFVLTACGHPNAASSASKPGGGNAVKVTMANDGGKDGCALNTTSVPAGPVTFTVANTNAPGITEVELLRDQRIIGEKENLAPGLDPVSFTVTLDGGSVSAVLPGRGNRISIADRDRASFSAAHRDGSEHPQPRHQGLRGLHRRPDRSAQRRREGARRRRAVGKRRTARESGLCQGAAVLRALPSPAWRASCCPASRSATTRATSTI